MAGWRTIAKNEIRLWTTKFRNHRKLMFYIVALIIIIVNIILIAINSLYVTQIRDSDLFNKVFIAFFIIPHSGLGSQIPSLQFLFLYSNIFSSIIIQLLPPIMEIACYFIFVMAITYPIQTSLQNLNIGHFELILSTPIKAKDMLLGNFLGRVPIYLIADLIIVPVFWTIVSLFIPLSISSYFGFAIIFFSLFIVGTFLGTICSSYLSLKLGQSEGGAEKARAYYLSIGIILVIPILLLSWFPFAFLDPNIQGILKFIPTTWFGDIINYTLFPDFLPFPILLLYIGLVSLFSIGVLSLGYHYGDRVYSLELGTSAVTTTIVKESAIYKLFRNVLGPLTVSSAKEFFRRKENLVKIVYTIILVTIMPIVMVLFSSQYTTLTDILEGNVMPAEFPIVITSFIFAIMFGLMFGSYIMIRSKDMIWIYKKSPTGVSSLVNSFFKVIYFLAIIISFPIVTIISIFLKYELLTAIALFGILNLWVFMALAMAIGIQCWRPAFKENSPKMAINILISMAINMLLFFSLLFLMFSFSSYFLILIPIMFLLIGFIFLRFGIKKLNSLE